MKGILTILFGLIMMLIVFKPANKESGNYTVNNTFSFGPAPVDIHVSIKSSAIESNYPVVQPVLSDNQLKPVTAMKDDLVLWN